MSETKMVVGVLAGSALLVGGLWYAMEEKLAPTPILPEVEQGDVDIAMADPDPVLDAAFLLPQDPPGQAPAMPVGQPDIAPPQVVPEVELPRLDDSDPFVFQQLGDVDGGPALVQSVVSEHLIRKFVVLVENVSRGILPMGDWPLEEPQEGLRARRLDDERFVMEVASHQRFDPIVNALLAVSPVQGMTLYQALYPLFQQAMDEIGYRGVDFNDVLIRAIDNVLAAPREEGPFILVQPSVQYLYEDERLESLSDVEKLLLRMGSQNAAMLRERLGDYRARLLALSSR